MQAEFGSISTGTMRPEDLIPTFASELEALSRDDRTAEESKLLADVDALENYVDEDAGFVLDELVDALQDRAPAYGYFGACEGDGADYGFWLSDLRDFEGPKVSDPAELDDLPEMDGNVSIDEALHVNDHGNVTLYARDGKGGWNIVWAVV